MIPLLLALAAAAPAPCPPRERCVVLETGAGTITIALAMKAAPKTAANFLRYAERGRFEGTNFYRAARVRGRPGMGFIQGGIRRDYRRMFPPIPHEPTTRTGLRHVAGTVSMARNEPGSAMGDFFIMTSTMPSMDAGPGRPGFAAFGRVVGGMDVVRRILARPTFPGGSGALRGQMLREGVRINRTRVIGG